MALKEDAKPMLPLTNHIQCADDSNCKFPGRIWFHGMDPKARVCVEHSYAHTARGERDDIPKRA